MLDENTFLMIFGKENAHESKLKIYFYIKNCILKSNYSWNKTILGSVVITLFPFQSNSMHYTF